MDIYPSFDQAIPRWRKELVLNQSAKIIWFTGLSGSGKTTLALALEKSLFDKGFITQLLDGDNVRTGINNNLGFSEADRMENIRRIGEVSKLFLNCGVITICAFISPTEKIREIVRNIIGEEDFFEIFVNTPLEVCEKRDIKGLYAKARAGYIKNFTGVNAPFEVPESPDFIIDTSKYSLEECTSLVLKSVLPLVCKPNSLSCKVSR